MNKKENSNLPTLPKRLERKEDRQWPSPLPLPSTPTGDMGRILKQILARLDVIEKRLENIERMLTSQHGS